MSHTAPLPKREAKVQISPVGVAPVAWRDVLDIDPIHLPVEGDGIADGYDGRLLDLVDHLHDHMEDNTWRLVWSDDLTAVRSVCPVCDDVFVVGDGVPDDIETGGLGGPSAMVCAVCVG